MTSGKSDSLRHWFAHSEQTIRQLKSAVHAAFLLRERSPQLKQAWLEAARQFHERYDELAYPGGFHQGLQKLAVADPDAIEVALCFVELRPYFFRSGYMFTALMRRLKRLDLNHEQAMRLHAIKDRQQKWQEGRADRLLARYAQQFDTDD